VGSVVKTPPACSKASLDSLQWSSMQTSRLSSIDYRMLKGEGVAVRGALSP
jgi:hypothetical protein